MARARNIKPSFFANDDLADINPLGRLLFIGLWTLCDREGRLEDRPRRIKAEALPYDECDIDSLLSDLEKHGFIQRYVVGEDKFIQVVNFTKHQNPHVKESASLIPAPDWHSASTVQARKASPPEPEQAGLIPDSPFPLTDSPSLNPDTGSTHTDADAPKSDCLQAGFDQAWSLYPKRAGGNSKAAARKAWAARLKAGASADDMLDGVKRYAAYCAATSREGTQFVRQASTFFGPDLHFEDDFDIPIEVAKPQTNADRNADWNEKMRQAMQSTQPIHQPMKDMGAIDASR